jgi:hypothetical protein
MVRRREIRVRKIINPHEQNPLLETLPKKSQTVEGFLRDQSTSLMSGWG